MTSFVGNTYINVAKFLKVALFSLTNNQTLLQTTTNIRKNQVFIIITIFKTLHYEILLPHSNKNHQHPVVMDRLFICRNRGCNRAFSSKSNRNSHEVLCNYSIQQHPAVMYVCRNGRCNRMFTQQSSRNSHEVSCNYLFQQYPVAIYVCRNGRCNRTFAHPSSRNSHELHACNYRHLING